MSPTRHGGIPAALLTQIARAGSAFVAGLVVARTVGPDGRGEVALALALGGFAVLVTTVPLNLGLLGATAREGDSERVFGHAGRVAAGAAFAAAALVLSAHFVLENGAQWSVPVPGAVAGGAAAGAVVLVFTQAWSIRGRLWVPALATIAGALVQLAVIGWFLGADSLTAASAVAGWVVGSMGVTMVFLVVPASRLMVRPHGPTGVLRHAARGGVAALLVLGVWRLDVVVLGVVRGPADVGIYAVGVSVAEAVFVLLLSVRTVLLSSLGLEPLRIALATRMTLLGGAVVAIVTVIAAPLLIELLFGEQFAAAIPVARVLVPSVVLLAAHFPLFDMLVARTDGNWLLGFATAFLGAYLVAVAVVADQHGPLGVAMVSAIAYTLLFVGMVARSSAAVGLSWDQFVLPRTADLRAVGDNVRGWRRAVAAPGPGGSP